MKKFVVTGGAGFIGSALVKFLKKQEPDSKIVVVDNLSTGRIDNLFEITGQYDMERLDIREFEKLGRVFYGAEAVFHLAALPSVQMSIEDPVLTQAVNLGGTLNVLEASRRNKVKKVVFSSSCAIYGDGENLSETAPDRPLSPYALQKLASEKYCQLYHELFKLPTVCLRYFNVFGPGQDPKSDYAAVIPRFITAAKVGEQLRIFGDGEQTRDFIYLKDILRANITALKKEADGGIFNVGSGTAVSINTLAQTILSLTGSKSEIKHERPRPGDIRHSLARVEKAAAALSFKTEVSLSEGLKRMIERF
ncbi:MAG: NAD-dependent epimerase/dehydratase family protein [Candidatus Wallbacteria bacterium]|nr:NAD-dependent epimerase/dehydratase family protein [Candidatus Wallbacteria bacterium]